MSKGMATCKICGRDFALIEEEHYVVKDPQKGGLAATIAGDAIYMYDAFNCPHCGCQYIAQPRKASVELDDIVVVGEAEDEDEAEEHDGCDGCAYEDKSGDEEPCRHCKQNYTDKYEREDEE